MNSNKTCRGNSLLGSRNNALEISSDDLFSDSDLDTFLSEGSDEDSSDNEDWVLREAMKSGVKRKGNSDCEIDSDLETKARTFVEERMTKALVRKCWKCRRRFIKEDGCNKMKCQCGEVTCYFCRLAVRHNFYDSLHVFCPAVTSPEDDSQAVVAAGKRARKKVMRAFPSLNLNLRTT